MALRDDYSLVEARLNSVLCENGYSSLMDYENDCVWVRVVFMLSFCFIAGFMMGFHWFLFEHWDSDLLL